MQKNRWSAYLSFSPVSHLFIYDLFFIAVEQRYKNFQLKTIQLAMWHVPMISSIQQPESGGLEVQGRLDYVMRPCLKRKIKGWGHS